MSFRPDLLASLAMLVVSLVAGLVVSVVAARRRPRAGASARAT
jgi:flagellar biosynthesis protein FliQ